MVYFRKSLDFLWYVNKHNERQLVLSFKIYMIRTHSSCAFSLLSTIHKTSYSILSSIETAKSSSGTTTVE